MLDRLGGRGERGGASARRTRPRSPEVERVRARLGLRVALPWLCTDTRLWPDRVRCSERTALAPSSSEYTLSSLPRPAASILWFDGVGGPLERWLGRLACRSTGSLAYEVDVGDADSDTGLASPSSRRRCCARADESDRLDDARGRCSAGCRCSRLGCRGAISCSAGLSGRGVLVAERGRPVTNGASVSVASMGMGGGVPVSSTVDRDGIARGVT